MVGDTREMAEAHAAAPRPTIPRFHPEGQPDITIPLDIDVGSEVLALFEGYVSGAKMHNDGSMALILGVPFAEKYKAMPVTDVRGEMFTVVVFKKAWHELAGEDEPDDVGDPFG